MRHDCRVLNASESESNMSLPQYIRFLARWVYLILGVTVVVVGIVALISVFVISKTYQSSATIIISSYPLQTANSNNSTINSTVDKNIISVYVTMGKSEKITDKVIDELALPIEAVDLRKEISIESFEDSGIIKITAQDKSPDTAQKIVNTLISKLKYESEQLKLAGIINIIDEPKVAKTPINPKPVLNILIAVVAGIFIGFVIAIVLEEMDDTIKEVPQVISFDTNLLGSIPKIPLRKSDAKEEKRLLSICSNQNESFKCLATSIYINMINQNKKVLLVTSSNSHEGKTTIAFNLALAMQSMSVKAIILDFDNINDLQDKRSHSKTKHKTNLYRQLGVAEKSGISNYFENTEYDINRFETLHQGVDFITSGLKPFKNLGKENIQALINDLSEKYEIIILDSPSILNSAHTRLLATIADSTLLVVKYRYTTHKLLTKCIGVLRTLNVRCIDIILNNVPEKEIL